MPYRWFVLPALGLAAVVVGALAWADLGENLIFYLTPTEAAERRSEFRDGERFRLGGLVESGSIAAEGDTITFRVTDGETTLRVVHVGTPPQLFQENVGVIVEGAWSGELVASDTLIVKHDEEYRSPDGDGPYSPPGGEASSSS